jgi:hypothetical protein
MKRVRYVRRSDVTAERWSELLLCAAEVTADRITLDCDAACYARLFPPTIAPAKSRGLGDTISKITKALGIRECGGCAKRRAKLNKLIPYAGTSTTTPTPSQPPPP